MNNGKVIYIPKDYILDENLKNNVYIRYDLEDSTLGRIWQSYDFEKAKKRVFNMQCEISKATFKKNQPKRIKLQEKLVHSTEARMLAVKEVSEKSKASPGVDGISWRTNQDKMRAAISLNNGSYKAKPLKQFIFKDEKACKERQIGIPVIYDRAMQVLYSYSLEPVAEALADRKSFAFRKGRSPEQVHSFIIKALTDIDAPEWILISDVKSYYDSISHKWLLSNLPMDRKILKEFLSSGYVFGGEVFNRESGISLGCNISTLIGNVALDGLQKKLYDLQGKKITDFYNGYCIRFADDVLITARTEKNARILLNELRKFVSLRGLKLSEKKTKIINVKEGFEFLSRFYCKYEGRIRSFPSQKAVSKFEQEIENIIFNTKITQNNLIKTINAKISGFSTYHKCEESTDIFRHLDCVINAHLIKREINLHPKTKVEQLLKRYWKKDSKDRDIYTSISNKALYVKSMADTVLIAEKPIDTKKNVFLDIDYFKELENNKQIQTCTGRYKRIWDRQGGKCYICSKNINPEQEKAIIYKRKSADRTIRNLAYIHKHCKDSMYQYVKVDSEELSTLNLREYLNNINKKEKEISESKFIALTTYFHNLKKKQLTLTFKAIEKIIKRKLCPSAYKYRTYFTNNQHGMIADSWNSQGYRIKKLDMKKQKIEFERVEFKRTKIQIPKFLYRTDLPMEAVEETKKFFLHMKEKYGLK